MAGELTEAFPYGGTLRERLRYVLQFAVLAPSTHNTQPWIFKIAGESIEVFADRERSLVHIDPDHRELTMSVGAAIDHLVLAMVSHHMEPEVALKPDPDRRDLLAVITVVGEAVPAPDQLRRFHQIDRRHTYRGAFDAVSIPADILEELQATEDGVRCTQVLDDGLRASLAAMVREGTESLINEPACRREVNAWIRRQPQPDGIPAAVAPEVERRNPTKEAIRLVHAPSVAVFSTVGDDEIDWLRAGMAVSRFCLTATSYGLRCSFYLQPIQFGPFRQELSDEVCRHEYPQIVVRVGYAAEGSGTPRRKLEDVLVERRVRGASTGGHSR